MKFYKITIDNGNSIYIGGENIDQVLSDYIKGIPFNIIDTKKIDNISIENCPNDSSYWARDLE